MEKASSQRVSETPVRSALITNPPPPAAIWSSQNLWPTSLHLIREGGKTQSSDPFLERQTHTPPLGSSDWSSRETLIMARGWGQQPHRRMTHDSAIILLGWHQDPAPTGAEATLHQLTIIPRNKIWAGGEEWTCWIARLPPTGVQNRHLLMHNHVSLIWKSLKENKHRAEPHNVTFF